VRSGEREGEKLGIQGLDGGLLSRVRSGAFFLGIYF